MQCDTGKSVMQFDTGKVECSALHVKLNAV